MYDSRYVHCKIDIINVHYTTSSAFALIRKTEFQQCILCYRAGRTLHSSAAQHPVLLHVIISYAVVL